MESHIQLNFNDDVNFSRRSNININSKVIIISSAEDSMARYNMCLLWDNDCNFIFDSWHSQSDGALALGIILSFVLSFFSVSFAFVKDQLLSGTRLKVTLAFVINYFIKILVMALVMTMNTYVCGAVVMGMALGQVSFEHIARVKKWKKTRKDDGSILTAQGEGEVQ